MRGLLWLMGSACCLVLVGDAWLMHRVALDVGDRGADVIASGLLLASAVVAVITWADIIHTFWNPSARQHRRDVRYSRKQRRNR